jgi:hypothetical protein
MLKDIDKNMNAFRHHYPQGQNFVVSSDIDIPFERRVGDLVLTFVNTKELARRLA